MGNANLEKAKFNYERESFELLIGKIPAMAEFQCSSYGQGRECIDISKLIAFKDVSDGYFDVFEYKNITIIEVYPEGNNLECNKGNHLNCGVYSLYYKKKASLKDRLIISSPVSLYYPDTGEYRIGKLIIEWYL